MINELPTLELITDLAQQHGLKVRVCSAFLSERH